MANRMEPGTVLRHTSDMGKPKLYPGLTLPSNPEGATMQNVFRAALLALLLSCAITVPSSLAGPEKEGEYQGYVEPAKTVEMKISINAMQAIHYAQAVRQALANQNLSALDQQGRACYNIAKFEDSVHELVWSFIPRHAEAKLYAPLAQYSKDKVEPLYERVQGLGGFAGESTEHLPNQDDVVGHGERVKLLVRLAEYEKALQEISKFHFQE